MGRLGARILPCHPPREMLVSLAKSSSRGSFFTCSIRAPSLPINASPYGKGGLCCNAKPPLPAAGDSRGAEHTVGMSRPTVNIPWKCFLGLHDLNKPSGFHNKTPAIRI